MTQHLVPITPNVKVNLTLLMKNDCMSFLQLLHLIQVCVQGVYLKFNLCMNFIEAIFIVLTPWTIKLKHLPLTFHLVLNILFLSSSSFEKYFSHWNDIFLNVIFSPCLECIDVTFSFVSSTNYVFTCHLPSLWNFGHS